MEVSKVVDNILSNAPLVNSAGLYHGKAGIALALFEASQYLQDESVADAAFNLFQEALIAKVQDYGFENGLSGIGYMLCYLSENKFIDADFDELFGEQYEKIVKSLGDIEKKPDRLLNVLQVIYFLSSVKQNDDRPQKIIKKIFEGLELFLTVQFQDIRDIHYINDKMAVVRIYELYLKMVNYADYKHFSPSLLENYAELYRTNRLISSLAIGYYLNLLATKNAIREYQDVISANIENGVKNIDIAPLSLQDRINAAKLIFDFENNFNQKIYDGNALGTINLHSSPLSYKDGLSRFLIFNVNAKVDLL